MSHSKKALVVSYRSTRSRLAGTAIPVVFAMVLLPILKARGQGNNEPRRPFTVRDSIEMTYIIDPALTSVPGTTDAQPVGEPIDSPDGKSFLLVTQRGDLATNALQATIWMFDCEATRAFASGKSSTRPVPKKIAVMSATSNVPVISGVQWVEGSRRIAFLGKDHSAYQRLFMADVEKGSIKPLTKEGLYVTAYKIQGATTVYTVLALPQPNGGFEKEMISADSKTALELLYPNAPSIEDITAEKLAVYPSSLHVQRAGKDIPFDFTMKGEPLRLFIPTFSLSPDAKYLVTVAPVQDVPKQWEQYQPAIEGFRLKAGVQHHNLHIWGAMERAEQYVLVNLRAGSVSPLIDAPVGRDMGYYVPTEGFWLHDSIRVVLTNTYLPFARSHEKVSEIAQSPAVTVVDVSTGEIQPHFTLRQAPFGSRPYYAVKDFMWSESGQALTLFYGSPAGDRPPPPERYRLSSNNWEELGTSDRDMTTIGEANIRLFVHQDLQRPPMLWAKVQSSNKEILLWNPNPQLESLKLGKVSVYNWQDEKGQRWSGLLALPADYSSQSRYPLVIQTHGYDDTRFFSEGEFTTGGGGRALVAKDIIVLQMEVSMANAATSEEGLDNMAGFQSAVDHLGADGLIDRRRVGVVGFSRTAYHAMYALTHRPDLFAAAVVTNANFSYVPYVLWSGGGVNELEKETEAMNGGVPWSNDNLVQWARNAPNFMLDRITAPLLLTATEQGEIIFQWEIFAGLRRLSKPVELLWWWRQNTPHILVQPAQRYASQQSVVDWFDFWLNRHEDSDPSKADQYARWYELRKLQEQNQSNAPTN
jgi:hypothetical protein